MFTPEMACSFTVLSRLGRVFLFFARAIRVVTKYAMVGFQHVDTTKVEKHKRWRGCGHKNAQWPLVCCVPVVLSDRYHYCLLN